MQGVAYIPGVKHRGLTRYMINQIGYTGMGLRTGAGAIPGGGHMETTWHTALWRQFGAAIAMLENALMACPTLLWTQRLWRDPSDHPLPPGSPPALAEFWYRAYHTPFWLDLNLAGSLDGAV